MLPYKLSRGGGILFIVVAVGFAVDALISYIRGKAVGGFPTLLFVMLLGFGVIMLSLGIIGVYIAQIYDEVKNRPQYIEREKLD